MKNRNSHAEDGRPKRLDHADEGRSKPGDDDGRSRRPDQSDDGRSKRPDHGKDERLDMEGDRGSHDSDRAQGRGAKRYSNQRRGGSDNNPSYNQGNRFQESYSKSMDSNMLGGYSQTRPSAPFIPASPASRLPLNPPTPTGAPYIHPGLHHHVQYPVPVTAPVPISLVGGPDPTLVKALQASAPGGVTPLMLPPVVSPDPVLLATAGPDSFTEVRGGVTYFNPTAQNILLQQRPMSKRPKAAIPIVDPSNVQSPTPPDSDSANNELDSHLNNRQMSQEHEFENVDKAANNDVDSQLSQEKNNINNEGLLSEQ